MNKSQIMARLREEWVTCRRCPLREERENVVFGEGNPDADILIIGEAPGEFEDKEGRPFVGESGEILNKFLDISKLDRETDLFITNVVGCRPTIENVDDRTGELRTDNRAPNKIEKEACRERLMDIIYMVDPMIIVTVGAVPLQALTGKTTPITKIRGMVQTMALPARTNGVTLNYALMPIFHTAYLYRCVNYAPGGPWDQTSKDFVEICMIIDYLREAYYGVVRPERWEEP